MRISQGWDRAYIGRRGEEKRDYVAVAEGFYNGGKEICDGS